MLIVARPLLLVTVVLEVWAVGGIFSGPMGVSADCGSGNCNAGMLFGSAEASANCGGASEGNSPNARIPVLEVACLPSPLGQC